MKLPGPWWTCVADRIRFSREMLSWLAAFLWFVKELGDPRLKTAGHGAEIARHEGEALASGSPKEMLSRRDASSNRGRNSRVPNRSHPWGSPGAV